MVIGGRNERKKGTPVFVLGNWWPAFICFRGPRVIVPVLSIHMDFLETFLE
jgi:hypothetical protein